MSHTRSSFSESINGSTAEGAPIFAKVNGERFECVYVRPMLAKPHRCVVMWSFKPGWKQYMTVSTRKVQRV